MTTLAVDTSVVIAAFSSWHERHLVALEVCASDPFLPQHASLETYATLCRMPEPFRASPNVVADYLKRRWADRVIVPPAQVVADLPDRCRKAGVLGSAIYDGLIGVTADAHSSELITLDRRALSNLMKLGVATQLL
jgi:predicted nucleic acid-binding protein